MRYFLLGFLYIFINQSVRSQFEDDFLIREKFFFEVGQIEEFQERFNFDGKTKLLKYLSDEQPELEINRKDLLVSLFDTSNESFDPSLAEAFINNVNDSINPYYLDFYDNGWYAEVYCIFEYNGNTDNGKLILKNQFNPDSSSKWVIAGVSSALIKAPDSKDPLKTLSPVSHGTDFIALYDIMRDGDNIQNYIANDYPIDTLTCFISLVHNNKIRLKQIYKVKYHFLQIPKWVFTVDYFNRKELSSGWLISSLIRVNKEEKKKYKADILKIY
ncbi:MAG: hypothetical protein DRJ05_03850 [Bacteroidetes bacterium]|nr:MAG: hypothetical protein DRJ05_03850 [Bacteroidota bacterium]